MSNTTCIKLENKSTNCFYKSGKYHKISVLQVTIIKLEKNNCLLLYSIKNKKIYIPYILTCLI